MQGAVVTEVRRALHKNLVVFDHPLISHKRSYLREVATGFRPFRALMALIAGVMGYEVTRSFETVPVEIETPVTAGTSR